MPDVENPLIILVIQDIVLLFLPGYQQSFSC